MRTMYLVSMSATQSPCVWMLVCIMRIVQICIFMYTNMYAYYVCEHACSMYCGQVFTWASSDLLLTPFLLTAFSYSSLPPPVSYTSLMHGPSHIPPSTHGPGHIRPSTHGPGTFSSLSYVQYRSDARYNTFLVLTCSHTHLHTLASCLKCVQIGS